MATAFSTADNSHRNDDGTAGGAADSLFVPLRFGGVFVRSLALFRDRPGLFLLLTLLWYIPYCFIMVIIPESTTAAATAAQTSDDPAPVFRNLAKVLLEIALTTLIVIGSKAAMTSVVALLYSRGNPTLIWSLRQVGGHFWSLLCGYFVTILGISLISGICVPIVVLLWKSHSVVLQLLAVLMGAAVLVAFLYVVLGALTLFIPAVMMERQTGPMRGIQRGFAVLRKDVCLVLGSVILLTLVGFIVTTVMSRVVRLSNASIVGSFIKNIPQLFLFPFEAILIAVLYLNIRIKHESLNRDALARELNVETNSPLDSLVNDNSHSNNNDDVDVEQANRRGGDVAMMGGDNENELL